jgi:hypothetical protein
MEGRAAEEPVIALALLLTGCMDQRVQSLERDIRDLSLAVDDLDADRRLIEQSVKTAQATGHMDYNRNPAGWDPRSRLPRGNAKRPDVILISIDTLRADHLGSYGYARDTSPTIDGLAKRGARFTSMWSPAPWTLPSHTTLLSGRLPIDHGVIEDHIRIPDDVHLVQEAFSAAGYHTAGVVATLFVSRKFGFDRGFDFFHDFEITDARVNNLATVTAENVFAHATHWAQQEPDEQPLFLFLHVYDVHYQYSPPPPWDQKFDRRGLPSDARYVNYEKYLRHPLPADQLAHQIAAYDEEIAYVDDQIHRFLERWENNGRTAYVAITADHGEEFAERGSWGHGHTLFPEQLHVPWVLMGPDIPHREIRDRAGTEDVAPTLAGLAGIPFEGPKGINRAQQLRTGVTPESDHVPAGFADTSRFNTNKIRWHSPPLDCYVDLVNGQIRLCDVGKDATCKTLADDPARGARCLSTLPAFLGTPWTAAAPGRVKVENGAIYDGSHPPERLIQVAAGQGFAVIPGDAKVSFQATDGKVSGPWQPLGGAVPRSGDPLAFTGRAVKEGVVLSEDEKAMLEELGYLQREGGGEEPGEGKSGKGGKAKAKAEGP